MTIIINVVPQITKKLFEQLLTCKANFRYTNLGGPQFDILEVNRFFMRNDSDAQIGLDFNILGNNINSIVYIHKENIIAFESN